MAIAFDAFTNGGFLPASFSHTVSARQNRLLWVPIVTATGEGTPVGVTANARALSLVTIQDNAAQVRRISLWLLVGPDTGVNTIAIDNTGLTISRPAALSYIGCRQSSQPDSTHSTGNTANVSTRTDTTTVVVTGAWTVMFTHNVTSDITAGSGVLRGNNSGLGVLDSGAFVPAGSQSLQAVASGATDWADIIISLTPAGGGMMGLF